jgi:hypothetical protein
VLAQSGDILVVELVRFKGELAAESECGAFRRREFGPVAIESSNFVFF